MDCDKNCSSCGLKSDCVENTGTNKKNPRAVKKVVAVMSGKGGVGKSTVTSLLAVHAARAGLKTAVLDADITGASIPHMFGLSAGLIKTERGIAPAVSQTGIKIVSANLLLDSESQPLLWRAPLVSKLAKDFFEDTDWGYTEIMFIDMPPGTGDIPLTVLQSFGVDGVILVTTPRGLVKMIVEKAENMVKKMQVPLLGVVENMAAVRCPCCNEVFYPFGLSIKDGDMRVLARLEVSDAVAEACDNGQVELVAPDLQIENIITILKTELDYKR